MDVEEIRQGLALPGKSRVGLAAALGIDVSQVSRLLSGKRQLKVSEVATIRSYLYGEAASVFADRLPVPGEEGDDTASGQLRAIRELLDEAEILGLDAMPVILNALHDAITMKRTEVWREQNQEALDQYNKRVANRGAFGDNNRNF
jgi:post-segregation antitoxin (ccd killing protein)